MKPYTYLLVNFLTVIICFVFSFHPKIRFDQHFRAFLSSSVLVALFFIVWDVWFTKWGVWWFDDDYLIGIRLLGLPVEEWLFFLCIPFSSVYTYFCLNKFFNLQWADPFGKFWVAAILLLCLFAAIFFYDKTYTVVTALVTGAALIFLQYIAKVSWIGRASFVYLVLMFGFIPVNGVLTGTGLESPVVNYNPDGILNLRVLTIPVEDFVYGYALILLDIYFFTLFQKKKTAIFTYPNEK
jgi:lycopene cyclase domain-containing protein